MPSTSIKILKPIDTFYAYVTFIENTGTVMIERNGKLEFPGGLLDHHHKVKVRGYDSDYSIAYALRDIVESQIGIRIEQISYPFEYESHSWFRGNIVTHFYLVRATGSLHTGRVIDCNNVPGKISKNCIRGLDWVKKGMPDLEGRSWLDLNPR